MRLRTASMEWNVLGKYGPHGEFFFFLIQKELVGETRSSFFNADIRTHLFTVDVLKMCALIALPFIAEEGRGGEDGCHAPDLGDEWEVRCQESPMWESEGEAWSEDENASSRDSRRQCVQRCVACHRFVWAW